MSDPLTPVQVHETLDENGWLDDSQGSGCYALRLANPADDPQAVLEEWTEHHDAAPQWLIDGFADAKRLAYVGAASDVYDRIMEHTRGDVRKAAVMRCYSPTEVLGVRRVENPFDAAERNYALEQSRGGWTVWCNGALI